MGYVRGRARKFGIPMKITMTLLMLISLVVCSHHTERFDDNFVKNCRAIGGKNCR
jgi:hypothetical protein